ncbi:MAG: hypothetical protein PHV00_05740 [Syntrophales bacterium]|nr:hypothetical protein [Syntrophales bacterium]
MIQATKQIEGRTRVSVQVVEVWEDTRTIIEEGFNDLRKMPFARTWKNPVGPGLSRMIRTEGGIVASQKDRNTGKRRPEKVDGLKCAGIPVGHHGGDENHVRGGNREEFSTKKAHRDAVAIIPSLEEREGGRLYDGLLIEMSRSVLGPSCFPVSLIREIVIH